MSDMRFPAMLFAENNRPRRWIRNRFRHLKKLTRAALDALDLVHSQNVCGACSRRLDEMSRANRSTVGNIAREILGAGRKATGAGVVKHTAGATSSHSMLSAEAPALGAAADVAGQAGVNVPLAHA